ncbi:MAG: tRNA (guanosine(46)-N7)-methyltransferase TrmB [Bacteroidales bacterium]|mgnify:CR=1 FL=1|nr:tRNA (guanosine(46)-N7)-methyltransferase TrmB [Bacteroidales bacterium]
MGSKNKLQRFAENLTFDNLFQYNYEQLINLPFEYKGRWARDFFKNDNPVVVELGCGKGEYTVGLAEKYPDKNFIGFDIKGARLWKGLTIARDKGLKNVAFVRTKIDHIGYFFDASELSEIWITFPDPQPRLSRSKKRLTSPLFLSRYRPLLAAGGLIHLKTDSRLLYDFTLETIKEMGLEPYFHDDDLYSNPNQLEVKEIRTFYEQIWLSQGLTIKYICFGFPKDEV